jgi:hypothetical protein
MTYDGQCDPSHHLPATSALAPSSFRSSPAEPQRNTSVSSGAVSRTSTSPPSSIGESFTSSPMQYTTSNAVAHAGQDFNFWPTPSDFSNSPLGMNSLDHTSLGVIPELEVVDPYLYEPTEAGNDPFFGVFSYPNPAVGWEQFSPQDFSGSALESSSSVRTQQSSLMNPQWVSNQGTLTRESGYDGSGTTSSPADVVMWSASKSHDALTTHPAPHRHARPVPGTLQDVSGALPDGSPDNVAASKPDGPLFIKPQPTYPYEDFTLYPDALPFDFGLSNDQIYRDESRSRPLVWKGDNVVLRKRLLQLSPHNVDAEPTKPIIAPSHDGSPTTSGRDIVSMTLPTVPNERRPLRCSLSRWPKPGRCYPCAMGRAPCKLRNEVPEGFNRLEVFQRHLSTLQNGCSSSSSHNMATHGAYFNAAHWRAQSSRLVEKSGRPGQIFREPELHSYISESPGAAYQHQHTPTSQRLEGTGHVMFQRLYDLLKICLLGTLFMLGVALFAGGDPSAGLISKKLLAHTWDLSYNLPESPFCGISGLPGVVFQLIFLSLELHGRCRTSISDPAHHREGSPRGWGGLITGRLSYGK